MGNVNRVMKMALTLAMMLAVALITSSIGYDQSVVQPSEVRGIIHKLIGEWIGAYEQFTDGKKADTKYFHAVIKESGSDTYQTVFDYYRLDEKTGAPIKVGESTMTTVVASDGTATNNIIGKGQVLIDPRISKPEQHDLREVLRVSPSGGMQGSGSGRISVSGMAFGMGRNGKVNDYRSDWTVQNGTLKISQESQSKVHGAAIQQELRHHRRVHGKSWKRYRRTDEARRGQRTRTLSRVISRCTAPGLLMLSPERPIRAVSGFPERIRHFCPGPTVVVAPQIPKHRGWRPVPNRQPFNRQPTTIFTGESNCDTSLRKAGG